MKKILSNTLEQFYDKADEVQKIIAPMEKIEITGIFYYRIYPDGTTVNLTSHTDWTKFYFEKMSSGGYKSDDIAKHCSKRPNIELWALTPKHQMWLDGEYYFDCGNGITLNVDYPNFRERTVFFSRANNHAINQFYVNELDTIRDLRLYFLLKANNIIKKAEQERILSSCKIYGEQNFHTEQLLIEERKNKSQDILMPHAQPENAKQILIHNKRTHLPMYLSPQRGQCLTLLVKGFSTKQIARHMSLSVRTVENYLTLLRKELGCRSCRELISIYAPQLYKQEENSASFI
jgi:DNA-binding CsgD family transcriptional regulator